MASDRLAELQRQRALAQAQLSWLDQEIARELGHAAEEVVVPELPASAPSAAPLRQVPLRADLSTAAGEFADQTPTSTARSVESVRRGCFVAFALMMGTVLLGTLAVYLIYRAKG